MCSNVSSFGGVELFKIEALDDFAKDFFSERLVASTGQIREKLKSDENTIRKEYLDACDRLFTKCNMQQERGEKGPIRFIYFFYLKSAMLTGKNEIQMNAYTELGYMDRVETVEFWYPNFIMDVFEQDMKLLDIEAKKRVMHYGYEHYMELKDKCFPLYISYIGKYIMMEMEKVISLQSFKKMKKTDDFEIVYSGYMDKGIRVFPPMKILMEQ